VREKRWTEEVNVRVFVLKALAVGLVIAGVAGVRPAAQGDPDAAKLQNPVTASPESLADGGRDGSLDGDLARNHAVEPATDVGVGESAPRLFPHRPGDRLPAGPV